MTNSLPGLKLTISRYLGDEISLRDLTDAFVPLGEILPGEDEALNFLWGRVELLLAEFSDGDLDLGELREELGELAPVPIALGARPVMYADSTTSSTTVTPEPISVRGSWLRGLQVARTPTEEAPASPVAHPA
jgi:hypothetical protein